jgi:hypothetical protein
MLRATLSEILVNPLLSQRYYQELIQPVMAALEGYIQEFVQDGCIQPVDLP